MQRKFQMTRHIQLNQNEGIAIISDLHIDNRTPTSRIDNILETCLEKLDDILAKCIKEEVRLLIFEGDVFDRLTVSHETVNRFGQKMLEYKKHNIDIYSIIGNHDIYRNGLEEFERTPLQTMFGFGIITCFDEEILINNRVLITPCQYTEQPKEADNKYPVNILVAHMFYGKPELIDDGKHNLDNKDVLQLGYDYILLGHDHEEFPPVQIGKTTIYRHGSVMRNSMHLYNFNRIPKFLVLKHFDNGHPDINEITIQCKNYTDIISQTSINRKKNNAIFKDIAAKLVNTQANETDNILETIMTDTTLSEKQKTILLNYINRN